LVFKGQNSNACTWYARKTRNLNQKDGSPRSSRPGRAGYQHFQNVSEGGEGIKGEPGGHGKRCAEDDPKLSVMREELRQARGYEYAYRSEGIKGHKYTNGRIRVSYLASAKLKELLPWRAIKPGEGDILRGPNSYMRKRSLTTHIRGKASSLWFEKSNF